MNKAVPWNIKGVDFDAREAAREAARRSGMTLGEWLNNAIAERAAETGIHVDDLDDESRLDAVTARLARISRRGHEAPRGRRSDRARSQDVDSDYDSPDAGEASWRRTSRGPSRSGPAARESRYADRHDAPQGSVRDPEQMLDEAMSVLEQGARKSAQTSEVLSRVVDRLSDIEARIPDTRPERADPPVQKAIAQLEARMEEISRARNASDPVDDALRNLDRKLSQIASFVEVKPGQAPARDASLERIEARIDQLARAIPAQAAVAPATYVAAPRTAVAPRHAPLAALAQDDDLDRLESKMNRLMSAMDDSGSSRERALPSRAATKPRPGLGDAVSEIRQRQQDLDRRSGARVDREAPRARPVMPAIAPPVERVRAPAGPDPLLENIRNDISALGARLDDMRRDVQTQVEIREHSFNAAGDQVISAVRQDIAALSHRLDDMHRELQVRVEPRESPVDDLAMTGLRREIAALGVRLDEMRREAQGAMRERAAAQPPADTVLPAVRREFAALTGRLDDLRRDAAKGAAPAAQADLRPELEKVRLDIATMSQSIAGLARRGELDGLRASLQELARTVEASRHDGMSAPALQTVERLTEDLRALVSTLERQPGVAVLQDEIVAIGRKVDTLDANRLDRATLDRVVGQTKEIRDIVTFLVNQPHPLAQMERQIAGLAERIDRLPFRGPDDHEAAALESGVQMIRTTLDQTSIGPLMQALESRFDALGRRVDEALARGATGGAQVAGLEAMIRDIGAKLERPANVQAPDLRALEGVVRDLGQKLERVATLPSAGLKDAGLQALQKQIRDLSEKLDRTPAPPQITDTGSLESMLADIGSKLDRRAGAVGTPQVDALEDAMRDLSRRLDSLGAQPALAARDFEDALQDISSKLDRAAPADSRHLEDLLRSLADKIDRVEKRTAAPIAVTDSLVDMVRGLADKIEDVRAPHADPHSLDALQMQIERMAERLDTASLGQSSFGGLERTINELFAQLEETRSAAVDAAETAARTAARDTLREAMLHGPLAGAGGGELNEAVSREIAELREAQDSTGRRMQATLVAVHETLAKVVDRLADLETTDEGHDADPQDREPSHRGELQRVTPPPHLARFAAAQPQQAARAAPAPEANTPAMRDEPEDDSEDATLASGPAPVFSRAAAATNPPKLTMPAPGAERSSPPPAGGGDFLIEPGSGFAPERRAETPEARIPVMPTPEVEPRNSQANFIAAARRAMQSNEPAADAPVAARGAKPATANAIEEARAMARERARAAAAMAEAEERPDDSEAGGRLDRVKAFVARRKRPILYGIAAVLVVLCSLQVLRTFTQAPDAPAEIAVEPAARDTAGMENDGAPQRQAPVDAQVVEASPEPAARAPAPPPSPPPAVVAPDLVTRTPAPGVKAPSVAPAGKTPATTPGKGASLSTFTKNPTSEAYLPMPQSGMQTAASLPTTDGQDGAASRPTARVDAGKTDGSPVGSIAGRPATPQTAGVVMPQVTQPGGYLRAAATAGNREAQYELAQRYTEGRSVPRDLKVAAEWFEKAAYQGLAPAQYRLAAMYEKGIGVNRDAAVARSWYKRAADAGNTRSMHNLAVLTSENGGDGKPDYATAAIWFRKAAERGVRDSQYNLAILYARGLGTEQNLVQSYTWFAIAAGQGDDDAGKKRDEVGGRLEASQIAAAKAAVAAFKPVQEDRIANDVTPPPGGWDQPQQATTQPAPKADPKLSQRARISGL